MRGMDSADDLIEQLSLQAHPEGGWYRETYRADAGPDGRASWTAINFLLKSGERSHWHRVDADELWVWQGGDPLELLISESNDGPVQNIILGGKARAGQSLQGLVPPHAWQAARPVTGNAGYALASCIVTPGFEFAGFELAAPDWAPGS